MSAIVCLYHRDGEPVQAEALTRMLDSLQHRGTDWVGAWREGPIGLGNRMFCTTSQSRSERMPRRHAAEDLTISADARLDNRKELWELFGREGVPGNDVPDSELILEAYRQWGESCPARLLGDFAFAIWDGRSRRLFCARDPLGVKPFFYHLSERAFVAASEIKGILSAEKIDLRLDENWVADYLVESWLDKTHTIYSSVRRLAPAHSLSVDARQSSVTRYWRLDPERTIGMGSDEDYLDAFRERFFQAVRSRVSASDPVGVTLSGGLDSSSIACAARAIMKQDGSGKLSTFSAVFPATPECDESDYFGTVLAQNGLRAHRLDVSSLGTLEDYQRMMWHLDQPMIGYNGHMGWALLRNAREAGVRILLDGTDGDTTLSHGDGYLMELATGWRWPSLIYELYWCNRLHGSPFWSQLGQAARAGIRPLAPAKIRGLRRSLRAPETVAVAAAPRGSRLEALSPEFVQRNHLEERVREFIQTRQSKTAREAHCKALEGPMLTLALESLDHMGAAFNIEYRFPFCDRRLVEFCLALPARWKMRAGKTRQIMREALAGVLPEKIRTRAGKADFTPFFNRALRQHDAPVIRGLTAKHLENLEPFVRDPRLGEVYERMAANELGVFETRRMWRMIVLSLWMREKKA
jgi:asparagine synthase (glutamine-hydrolysing)